MLPLILENTDRRITDIYLEAGFESQRTFNRCLSAEIWKNSRRIQKIVLGTGEYRHHENLIIK